MCRPFRRTRTSPTSRNTRRCFETEGCSSRSATTICPTSRSSFARYLRISRRRGSATALNGSEVVAALAMSKIYSYIGICVKPLFIKISGVILSKGGPHLFFPSWGNPSEGPWACSNSERSKHRIYASAEAPQNQKSTMACKHVKEIKKVTSSAEGCEDCLKIGGKWVHLRLCLSCGHVGCCDSSPNRHATKHCHGTKHPIMKSFEPGEDWRWCYVDEIEV